MISNSNNTTLGSTSPGAGGSGMPSNSKGISSNGVLNHNAAAAATAAASSLMIPSNSTVTSLESKLKLLKDQSHEYNALLTQKLASSQSGQNLLHIGTSLSSLPPDLHMMITALHPLLVQIENLEKQQYSNLTDLFINQTNSIQYEIKKFINTQECAEYYQDLMVAERTIQTDKSQKSKKKQQQQQQQLDAKQKENSDNDAAAVGENNNSNEEEEQEEELLESLDHLASLERAAHTTLNLVHDLQLSSAQINSVLQNTAISTKLDNNKDETNDDKKKLQFQQQQQQQPDTERAQFLMKLSPRIRRLESDTIQSLTFHMDLLLKQFQLYRLDLTSTTNATTATTTSTNTSNNNNSTKTRTQDLLLLMMGHVMRGLTLLGRGKEVESIFARVAIMPLIRSKVSMGRLDEGGSRGECTGLSSLLDDIITSIANIFGPMLAMSESMFQIGDIRSSGSNNNNNSMDVDLITEGVWIPIVTTFMAADTGIKMAIFSPGIANILQRNYIVLDTFLNQLSKRLLFTTTTTCHQQAMNSEINTDNTEQEQEQQQQQQKLNLDAGTSTTNANPDKPEETQQNSSSKPTMEDQKSSNNNTNVLKKDLYEDYSYDFYYYHHHILNDDNNKLNDSYKNDTIFDDATTNDDDNENNSNTTIIDNMIQRAQNRIYCHKKTIEFYKKWNLPIYYQLRFGECCSRLNSIINSIQKDGWLSPVVSDDDEKRKGGGLLVSPFELPFFIEFYDILSTFWKSHVFLKPLTNRFLRGSIQMIGRTLAFIKDSMEGKILFGMDPEAAAEEEKQQQSADSNNNSVPAFSSTRSSYCWGESEADVGAVAWELTVLKSFMTNDYVDLICNGILDFSANSSISSNNEKTKDHNNGDQQQQQAVTNEHKELRVIITDTLRDVCDQQINPIINTAWNEVVVKILISKCSQPLAAVKGVAATYRMTNRPPPVHPSPFVTTILRPLHDFDNDFKGKAPSAPTTMLTQQQQPQKWWKHQIIATVAERYSVAVEELLVTVARTEVALKNRKTALRTMRSVGGMTDGEKVKLQVYLDFQEFEKNAQTILGCNDSSTTAANISIPGMEKLRKLTIEGESLLERAKNRKK